MPLSELRENAECAAIRVSSALDRAPKLVADHIAGCVACREVQVSQSELGSAFAALRAETLSAPPGLASSVVDSLGVRLAGDRVGSEAQGIRSLNHRQRLAAVSTAVVAAAATGLVVSHRKRAELAH